MSAIDFRDADFLPFPNFPRSPHQSPRIILASIEPHISNLDSALIVPIFGARVVGPVLVTVVCKQLFTKFGSSPSVDL